MKLATRSLSKNALVCLLALCVLLVCAASPSLAASPTTQGRATAAASYLPIGQFRLEGIDGPYHTQGHLIYGADDRPYLFHGVARDDLEYLCTGDSHYTPQELAYMGQGTSTAHATYWGSNTVRIPMSENFWLYGDPSQGCTAAQYQSLIQNTIAALTRDNLNVMLDLQWSNAGGQATAAVGDFAGDSWSMPDQDSLKFWQQIASIYKSNDNVLFEIFNEPHIASNSWSCWRNGCWVANDVSGSRGHDKRLFSYQGIGMQTLVNAIRQVGANNLVIVGGLVWGFDLSQIPTYHLDGTNIIYDAHPYPYQGKTAAYWDAAFGNVSATYPVISAESGEYDCKTAFMSQLIDYFDAHDIGWIGWAWSQPAGSVCEFPLLTTNLTGTPSPAMGEYEFQYLHLYLELSEGQEIPAKLK